MPSLRAVCLGPASSEISAHRFRSTTMPGQPVQVSRRANPSRCRDRSDRGTGDACSGRGGRGSSTIVRVAIWMSHRSPMRARLSLPIAKLARLSFQPKRLPNSVASCRRISNSSRYSVRWRSQDFGPARRGRRGDSVWRGSGRRVLRSWSSFTLQTYGEAPPEVTAAACGRS